GQATVRSECESGARGCVDCKMQLAAMMNAALEPIRERRADLEAHPGRVREILGAGADRARAVAQETMREVREAMNIPTRENV
ncbi:MAG: tryptophan--tRNA ligase, partial [Candidatus Krumholzibacteria bacterium]|nr:tryptophan--tRNA ligase [Candidatus Krumholzibacteria bacterium]